MFEDKKFIVVVLQAADECSHLSEEEGGIILERAGDYTFIKIENVHKGTQTAISLYEAYKPEMGRILFEKMKDGWRLFGSFHTHPLFEPYPSSLDRNTLFQGFAHNVIYAPRHGGRFSYTCWENDEIKLKTIISRTQLNENR